MRAGTDLFADIKLVCGKNSLTHTHITPTHHSYSLQHTHSNTLTLAHSHTHLQHTHSHTLTPTHSLTHTFNSHTLLTHSNTLTPTLTPPHSHTHSLSLTHTHSLQHTHSHTHSHSHTSLAHTHNKHTRLWRPSGVPWAPGLLRAWQARDFFCCKGRTSRFLQTRHLSSGDSSQLASTGRPAPSARQCSIAPDATHGSYLTICRCLWSAFQTQNCKMIGKHADPTSIV